MKARIYGDTHTASGRDTMPPERPGTSLTRPRAASVTPGECGGMRGGVNRPQGEDETARAVQGGHHEQAVVERDQYESEANPLGREQRAACSRGP